MESMVGKVLDDILALVMVLWIVMSNELSSLYIYIHYGFTSFPRQSFDT